MPTNERPPTAQELATLTTDIGALLDLCRRVADTARGVFDTNAVLMDFVLSGARPSTEQRAEFEALQGMAAEVNADLDQFEHGIVTLRRQLDA